MSSSFWKRTTCARLAVIAALVLGSSAMAQEEIVPKQVMTETVKVRDVSLRDGTVSGYAVNDSPTVVRDVRLLVRYVWHWKDEHNPGENSPGRAAYHTIPADIAPGQSQAFSHRPDPPLPDRTDGWFEAQVEVVGFSEVGP